MNRAIWAISILFVTNIATAGMLAWMYFSAPNSTIGNIQPVSTETTTSVQQATPQQEDQIFVPASESGEDKEVKLSDHLSYKIKGFLAPGGNRDQISNAYITFLKDGKDLGTMYYDIMFGEVTLWGTDSQYAYFSITPGGLGGAYIYPVAFNVYKIDLTDGNITELHSQSQSSLGVDVAHKMFVFSTRESGKFAFYDLSGNIVDLQTVDWRDSQMSPIEFSPDGKQIAYVLGDGPADLATVKSTVYIMDIATGATKKYLEKDGATLYVKGWKDNKTLDIQPYE